MRRAEGALLVVAALGVGVAAPLLAADGPTGEALLRLVQGGGAALAGLVGACGAGGALLRRLDPALLEDERGLLHAATLGLGLWALLAGLLAAAGLLTPPLAAALPAVLAAGWLARPRLHLPRLDPAAALLALVVVLAPGLVVALAPPPSTPTSCTSTSPCPSACSPRAAWSAARCSPTAAGP